MQTFAAHWTPRLLIAGISLATLFVLRPASGFAQEGQVVAAYLLAGQSNMEGKAKNSLLDYQAGVEPTQQLFSHLRAEGRWVERDDAFIKFLKRSGPLTVGYGSRDRTGMELQFGWRMAEEHHEPVLLIKAAWGGHSLFKAFRPPSAGPPEDELLEQELKRRVAQVQKRNEKNNRDDPLPTLDAIRGEYGASYRRMVEEVRDAEQRLGELFPPLKGKRIEMRGFVWFQGWNDQYGGAEQQYARNMECLIRDMRREFQAPKAPFVICVMGQNGSKPAKGAMQTIQQAQLAMEKVPDFVGNVRAVRTDVLVDKVAEEQFPTWKQNIETWEKVGSDFPYHYLGSAVWFHRIGDASASAMLELQSAAK